MDWLVASNIALWAGLIIVVVMNLALARQIGVLHERVAPAGALLTNRVLRVGEDAPLLSLETLRGETVQVGAPVPGKSQLLFFVSPDCPVCNELIPVFKSAARTESGWLRAMLASDGIDLNHRAYVESKGLGEFPYLLSELLGKSYGVSQLPYAVLIDEQGKVASMGIVNTREHLESLFEAKERNVASIQEYLKQNSEVTDVEADPS
ncbi:MAG: redoxin family protein [Halieaceae bacterium]|nr:redoxin family protein [Halieaceae bacterium]